MHAENGHVMPTVAVAILLALLLLLLLLLVFPRRRFVVRRTVLLHAPVETAWACVRDFPTLLSSHGRARAMGAYDRHTYIRGNGGTSGSIWRSEGRWGASNHWVEVEIVRHVPEREITVRLVRDSLRTQSGLRFHHGRLSLMPSGPDSSKLTWEIRVRFRGFRLLLARWFGVERLKARLLDIGLRSVKLSIDELYRQQSSVAGEATGRQCHDDGPIDTPASAASLPLRVND